MPLWVFKYGKYVSSHDLLYLEAHRPPVYLQTVWLAMNIAHFRDSPFVPWLHWKHSRRMATNAIFYQLTIAEIEYSDRTRRSVEHTLQRSPFASVAELQVFEKHNSVPRPVCCQLHMKWRCFISVRMGRSSLDERTGFVQRFRYL